MFLDLFRFLASFVNWFRFLTDFCMSVTIRDFLWLNFVLMGVRIQNSPGIFTSDIPICRIPYVSKCWTRKMLADHKRMISAPAPQTSANLKLISLVVLIAQTTALVLILRYSRTQVIFFTFLRDFKEKNLGTLFWSIFEEIYFFWGVDAIYSNYSPVILIRKLCLSLPFLLYNII